MEVSVQARMLHKMRSVTLTTYVWCGVWVIMPVERQSNLLSKYLEQIFTYHVSALLDIVYTS